MKRKIVSLINEMLRPLGISVYKVGFDMDSALRRLKYQHHVAIQTVIDLGASNGKWCKLAMKHFPDAQFLAIEPLIERQGNLEKLKKSNNNFNFEICAAGADDNKIVKMMVTKDLDGSTISGVNNFGTERNINIFTIDSLISKRNLCGPYLLKFDTHGYEVPILKGAHVVLKNTAIIIMEVYNFRLTDEALLFNEMINYMDQLGFRCFDIADPLFRPIDNVFWQVDLYFTRKDNNIFTINSYNTDLQVN